MSVFRTKSVEQSIAETDEPEHRLKKNLGALDLTVFGVGVIIGAGHLRADRHGGRLERRAGRRAVSFAIAGVACALAALCYAEFASTVPVAGSAYTFSYATLGELVAWIIGWDLVLEFTIGAAALSTSFSGYFQEVVDGDAVRGAGLARLGRGRRDRPARRADRAAGHGVLIAGIKLSSRVNQVVVAIKLLVVAAVIVFGVGHVEARQLHAVHPALGAGGRGVGRLPRRAADQLAARASTRPCSAWPA